MAVVLSTELVYWGIFLKAKTWVFPLVLLVLVLAACPASAGAAATGDDYPSQWRNIPMDSVFDSWGEYNRECTSAVAWWLHERNGFEMPFHDNASGWGPDAQSRGYAVNGTPAVGAVAWWGPGNHVAWVAAVGAGTVTIEEYNYDYAGHYHERTIPSGYPSGYIHFKDLPSGPPGEGSFVAHNGFVYRIAGGAPVYVSNWAAVGGPQTARNLSDAEFGALPQYPRDGTLLGASDGRVYVVAGGAPLWVSNWAAIGGPQPSIGIDGAAVTHAGDGVPWDHLRSNPANGTLLGASDGRVYVVAGGAPLWVSNWAAIGGPQPSVHVDRWAVENPDDPHAHLRSNPANGTLLGASDGRVYVVAGGAPLWVSNWAAIGGPQPSVPVDRWAVENPDDPHAHLRRYPADGTLLGASDGRVYIVAGGAPLYLSNWNVIGGPQPSVHVDRWAVENPGDPHAHLHLYPADGTFIRGATTGRVYRVAGGAPIYVSTWSIFGGTQHYVNVDQWAIDNTPDPHAHLRAAPLDGTRVEGLPSHQYWSFAQGLRTTISPADPAVAVDDYGLGAFGISSTVPSAGPVSAAPRSSAPAAPARSRARCHHRKGSKHRCGRHRHRSHHHRRR